MESYVLKLPVLSVGMEEGDVVEVNVSVGQHVRADEPIMVVETEKVQIAVESPVSGTVREILVGPGMTVPVGQALLVIDRDP